MLRVGLTLVFAAGLSGCVFIDAGEAGKGLSIMNNDRHGEPVHAARVEGDTLIVQVKSNGCTNADSFRVDVDKTGNKSYRLELDRRKPDPCKAFLPDGAEVRFDLEKLGVESGAEITLANPLVLSRP